MILTIVRPNKKDRVISFDDTEDLDGYLYNDFRAGIGITYEEIAELHEEKTLRLSSYVTLKLSEVAA